jgi:hypothetical protein
MIQYNILPNIRPSRDVHKKYSMFFNFMNVCLGSYKKTDEYFGIKNHILYLVEQIKNNQFETDGFSIINTSVLIKPSITYIYNWNDVIGEEPTEEFLNFIYEIKELNDTYIYHLDKLKAGVYYPKKKTFFHYEIFPCIDLILLNHNPTAYYEINIGLNILTYIDLQSITQKIKQVIQGTISQYACEFEDCYPLSSKNPSIYSYYYMLVSQETTIFGRYFEDKDLEDYGDSWSDEVIIEASTLQVYQLFKDYEDCWYEAENGLPIHWRKSLK